MSDNKGGLDLLGIKPIADAVNTTVVKSFEGIEGFLQLVCVPALEEVGLLLKDKVRSWRLNNVLNLLQKAQNKFEFVDDKLQIKAHPRVALSIIENSSLNDNDELQELWAGLFISSCTKDGQDDENLIFVDLLKQLTVIEARIFKYTCEQSRKIIYKNGLLMGDNLEIGCEDLKRLTGINDIHRLDRELDHLSSINLINGGFDALDENLIANITPSALGLNLYVKSQGFNDDPANFWQENIITAEALEKENIEKEKIEEVKRQTEQMNSTN